jgi:AraC-like DNA-binding protein
VLAQRLARAHCMLVDPRRDGEKISAVAYDCGFGDVSYFNRDTTAWCRRTCAQARHDAPDGNSLADPIRPRRQRCRVIARERPMFS